MNVEDKIQLDKFSPRWYQTEIWDAIENKGYRKVLLVAPRRSGKDITAWNLSIRQCLKKVCLVYYALPEYGHARKAIWDAITIDGNTFLSYIPSKLILGINQSEMKISFVNGSILQCIGADSYNTALVGTNPYGIVLSEYALMDPEVYAYSRPILAANGGWILVLGTPRGKNHFWHLYKFALESDQWHVCYQKTSDIHHISDEVLFQEKLEMSEELYLQEYECFPENSSVLTPFGVSAIQDLKVGDFVISHTGRAQTIIKTMNRFYQGNMVRIKSFGTSNDIICTPEHPIKIYNKSDQSYNWIKAKEITKNDFVVFPKLQTNNISIISFEMCMIIAWYITEGSCGKNYVQFSLSNDKKELERVCNWLIKKDFNYTTFKSTGWQIIVNSTQLVDFLSTNCGLGALNKHIPFGLISGHENAFFDELLLGDGCKIIHNGYERYIYTTISKSLAYQVQLLAHSLGRDYAAGISIKSAGQSKIENRIVNNKESYSVQINIQKNKNKDCSPWLIRAKHSIAARVKEVELTPYNNQVYNLHIKNDESYIVEGRAVHNCSFERGIEGSWYGRSLEQLRLNGHIGSVPYEPGMLVYTAWDIGVNDATTIIWFQVVSDGSSIRIIDCYSNTGFGLDHFAKIIQNKSYVYGKHFAPHDIKVREWGGGAITRYEKARQLGIEFTILDQALIEDGIENVLTHFPKFWIDKEKCRSLINALENYRREWDEVKQIYKSVVVKDWSCHLADATRYMCMALYKTKKGMTPEEFDRMKKQALYGNKADLPRFFRDDIKYHQYK
jgi:hypothetical protein